MQVYRRGTVRAFISALKGNMDCKRIDGIMEYNREAAERVFNAVRGGCVAHYWLYGHKVHAIVHPSTRGYAMQISMFDEIGALSHMNINTVEDLDRELPVRSYINVRRV